MANPRPPLSKTELEVLKALWDKGAGTVRDVDAALQRTGRRWAYTTVQTLLHRLQAKGYVASDKREVPHVFQPSVSRDGLLRQQLKDLAKNLCGGMPAPLVLALVEGQRFSADEIEQFRKLLDELEAKQTKG